MGSMRSDVISLDTSSTRVVDLTPLLRKWLGDVEGDGLVHVFAPHATAGLALMETGSGSEADLEETLRRLLPRDDRYVHRHGSVGHGADHLVPAFISPSLSIPVTKGEMQLGTWQSIVLVDLNEDNPRRHIRVSFLAA